MIFGSCNRPILAFVEVFCTPCAFVDALPEAVRCYLFTNRFAIAQRSSASSWMQRGRLGCRPAKCRRRRRRVEVRQACVQPGGDWLAGLALAVNKRKINWVPVAALHEAIAIDCKRKI